MFAEIEVGVDREIVLIREIRRQRRKITDVNGLAVHTGQGSLLIARTRRAMSQSIGGGSKRELLQNIGHGRIRVQGHQLRQSCRSRHGYRCALRCQPFVLEFISSINEKFIPENGPADISACAVVVEARQVRDGSGLEQILLLIIGRVVIAVAVVPPTPSVPIVGPGLCHDVELAAGGMAVFGAELIC